MAKGPGSPIHFARRNELAGRAHELWTGVVLWRRPDDFQMSWQEATRVFVHPFADAELDIYLATRQWEGCSGAYAIQGENDPYVKVMQGSVSNVVGLPMESLANLLAAIRPLKSTTMG